MDQQGDVRLAVRGEVGDQHLPGLRARAGASLVVRVAFEDGEVQRTLPTVFTISHQDLQDVSLPRIERHEVVDAVAVEVPGGQLDVDQFVQVGAIQTVGEFLYQEALPVLVKVLRDPDATVRDESLRQLIRMTGKNDLNFDVRGSDSVREKAIRKWEKWLKDR